jgi:acetyl-CoA acetyltransferase
MARRGYDDVVIVAPVTVPYVRFSVRSAHWFLGAALATLLKAAKIRKSDIDGLAVSSFSLAPDSAVGFTQYVGMDLRWLDHVPMGGASAVLQLRRAARAVESGDANIVACIAGDTNHVDSFRQNIASFSQFARDAVYPYGAGGPNGSFAFLTDYVMRQHGVTAADFGKLCVAQRANAASNPYAMLRKPLTLDEYLSSRMIADPVRLFDCVMPCAGADGFLVTRREIADRLGLPRVRLLGSIERHNAFAEDQIQVRGGWAKDIDELYAQAESGPEDMDFLQAYDDYPVIVMMQLEDLGFCEKGGGANFVGRHTFTIDGSFPLNTSGGQLSMGQAGAAGGHLGMVEAIRQLIGKPLTRQVPNARRGLVSGFGMINYDRGICTGAAILGSAA